jgi:dUTP pyrophosphatase
MNVGPQRASAEPEADETTYVLKRPPPSEAEEVEVPLKVKKLSPNATLPVRASIGAAGYDLFSAEDCTIEPRTRKVVKTDLSMAIPARHYGRVAPRSGLSFKFGIDIAAGVIDSDYRGPLGIVMVNNGTNAFEVKAGDRVAQLLLERVSTPEVEEVEELDDTVRGTSGFGSTGTAALAKQ